jgi:hypothetical protein
MLPPVPNEAYCLHDVPSDMDSLLYELIVANYSEEKVAYEDSYWTKAFDENSNVDHKLELVKFPIDMVQEPLVIPEEHLRRLGFFENVGELPPLVVNRNRFVDGRHRLNTYNLLGKESAVAIDLAASGIDVESPQSSLMY